MKTYSQFNESKIRNYDEENVEINKHFRNVDKALIEYTKELKQIIVENNPDFTDMDINIMLDEYSDDIKYCFSNDIDVMDCYDEIIINYQ